MGGYNDARQGAPYPPPQPFPNPHQQVYPPMQYGYPQPVRMFDQNGRPMYVAATVQPEMVQNVPYINFHPDYAHQQYGPPLPQPVMATKPREPIPPRERKPLVLVNPDSQEIVNLPSPPSRPLSKNPTPNTTHDSEVIVDKMRVREELHAMVKQVVTAPVAQSEPKPQPVKNTMPSAWDKPHDFSKVVEKHTPLGKKPVEQRIPAVELKKVIKEPTPVTEKKLTPKPVDPKKVVTEATPVVEKSVEPEKVSIKSTPVVEKPVEPKKVAEKSVDSKKVVDMPTPVPEKPVDQEKKPEVTPEQEKSVDNVIKLEKAVEDAVEAPVEPSETPKEEAEAVTNTPSESTLAEGGPSLFEAPEGFGADDQANSQEDLTADEDDDCESVAEVDEEKLREEEETERLRLESIQKLKELELNLEELDKKMKAPQVYDRELMNCVRAIEELSPTNPPLTKEKIKDFGLDPGAKPEPQRFYDNRQIPKNPYNKIPPRNSQGGGFRQHSSSYQKRAPVMGRNSIERAPKVDLKNKAVNAWKAYKIKPEDMEKEEIRIEQVRSLLNKITPTNKEELIGDFLKLSVSGPSPAFDAPEEQLSRVISVMFDKAVEEPRFCSLYSEICKRQVEFELRVNRQSSRFRNSILSRAQGSFVNKTMDEEKEAFEQETDEEKKKILKAKYDEDFVKFRRRKFGNINFIGQLYHQQLLSSKIIQWCFYDLLRATYPDKETGVIPKPPYDEESLQCATHLLEVVGKNFEAAKDFNQAQDYLNQTVAHLMSISGNCSPKIKFKIIGVKELKDHKWKPRNVVEQGPKKISEIHQEIQKEQQQLNQARDAYERKQSNVGFRQNSTSIPRRDAPPPARGSQDARIGQIKRAQAAYSSIKAPLTAASPRNMSMAQTVVPRRKSAWASGASGGGSAADSPGSRTILQRGEKESALNNARNLAKDTPRSVKPPVLSPEEQEKLAAEKLEWEAKLKKLPQRIKSDLEEIEAGDLKVEELTEDLFKTPNNDKCLTDVFSCFAESCAQNISKEPTLVQAGHILRSWLKKPHYKQHIFRGIEDYCQKAVGESLSEDFPKLWTNLGLVIAKLLQYEEQAVQNENEDPAATTTSSTAVSLSDFGAIFKAGVDGSSQKRYALLVASLKHLVEQLPSGDEEQLLGLRFEFDTLCDKLKMDGLDGALQACNVDVVGYKNLFEALKSQ